jgi:hypothetical protein
MRALSKLKITKKQIQEILFVKSKEPLFVGYLKGSNSYVVNTSLTQEEFMNNSNSVYDKLNDLIDLERTLKKKIAEANNNTIIKFLNTDFSLTEILYYKETIIYKRQILSILKNELYAFQKENESVSKDIENQARASAKNISKDNVTQDELENRIAELSVILGKASSLKLVDPLHANELINGLDREITKFEEEIDFVLNEANSKIEIEI